MTRDWPTPSLLTQKLTLIRVGVYIFLKNKLLSLLTQWPVIGSLCRWNVYIRLFAYATLSHIQSDLERWHYAWTCPNYYIRANHDAWFCYYWELCYLHGSSYALQAKGILFIMFNGYARISCLHIFFLKWCKSKKQTRKFPPLYIHVSLKLIWRKWWKKRKWYTHLIPPKRLVLVFFHAMLRMNSWLDGLSFPTALYSTTVCAFLC